MTRKRLLSIMLCLALCLSLFPAMASAAEDTSWYDDAETEFTLMDADDLYGFASLVNGGTTFDGKTVKLGASIDLGGALWTPIGNVSAYPSITFYGTFDGQGNTISNFSVSETGEYAAAGLFGSIMGTIKNVTVDSATIKSTHYAGGIVAYSSSSGSVIENCTVKNSSIVSEPLMVGGSYDNGDKVGGIMGYNGENGTVTGCTVENVSIKAYRDVGGIVGCSTNPSNVTGNTVRNITVHADQETGYYGDKTPNHALIVGRTGGADVPSSNTAEGTNTLFGPGDPVPKAFAVAGIGDTYYRTFEAAIADAKAGDEVQVLKAGTYKLPNLPDNITITGSVDGVVINATGSGNIASVPNGATFDNLTFNFGGSSYHGFQHAGDITMKGCTLNGLFFSYGNMSFDGCTFNAPGTEASGVSSKDYSMWAYGQDLTFTDCTFNCAGKCINVFCENNSAAYNITASGCTFNSTVPNKAAFNVKETSGANVLHYVVSVTDCTTNGNFPAATAETADSDSVLVVFDPLVQVDDRIAGGTENGGEIKIVLNGSQVYQTPAKDSQIDKYTVVGFVSDGETGAIAEAKINGETVPENAGGTLEIAAAETGVTVEVKFNRGYTFGAGSDGSVLCWSGVQTGTTDLMSSSASDSIDMPGSLWLEANDQELCLVIRTKALPMYDINVELDGNGTASADLNPALPGETIKLTAEPDDGYRFKEWQSADVTISDDSFTMPEQAVTVTAVFEEIPSYAVTFNMNGHGTAVTAQTVVEGNKAEKPADPSADGYIFDGWYADEALSTAFDFDAEITADTDVYAKWMPIPTYTVTFNMNGHGTQIAAQTVEEGSKAAKPADPSADGYTFDGWYADEALSKAFDFNAEITAGTNVYAKWTPIPTYTVTFNMNGQGTQIAAQTVEDGSKATKPADPSADGYTFGGWYADATLSMEFDFNTAIGADTTIYAKWTKIPVYTIIFGADSEWTKGSTYGLVIKSDAPFAKFVSVEVDGATLAASNYTAEEGSTIINLKPAYLESQKLGKHSIVILSSDGSAATNFTVKPKAQPGDPTTPPTGDNSNLVLWATLLVVSGSMLAGAAVYGRKRKFRAE